MAAVILGLLLASPVSAADRLSIRPSSDTLPPRESVAEALDLIGAIDPPSRLGDLATLQEWQRSQGGGFYGVLPDPAPADLDPPSSCGLEYATAVTLVRRRQASRASLAATAFPLDFLGAEIPQAAGPAPAGMRLELDWSVIACFLDALADGEVSASEAKAIAALPANREMLRHRRDLGYVPEPLPTEASLARMIARAGSGDPLDRVWCWLSPANFLGYADLVEAQAEYGRMVVELARHHDRLEDEAVRRVAPHLPEGFTFDEHFALTVGSLIRGWTTTEMSGLNIEQLKDDWPRLLRTMTEELYHRLQLRLVPTADGSPASDFDDLVPTVDDDRQAKLAEIMLYTVLEGTANLAAGPAPGVGDPDRAAEGSALLTRFVTEVVDGGRVDDADGLIGAGLLGNGPLYALGFRLARLVAADKGPRAIPDLLARGPVAFALEAQRIAPPEEAPLSPVVERALTDLASSLLPGGRIADVAPHPSR
jgi:hypothetical protein